MRISTLICILATAATLTGLVTRSDGAGNQKNLMNSVGMEFVWIPAGTFTMGSPPDEPYRNRQEVEHPVTISKPFYMQTTEVNLKQWRAVMGLRWYNFFGRKRGPDDLPVTKVCHYDVQSFLKKLNALGEGRYRLPTEAEWEYAARAGTTTSYSWGDRISCGRALYANKEFREDDCRIFAGVRNLPQDGPAPVKSYDPNPWGLYDMHGNVWEWTSDTFGPYARVKQTDPQGSISGEMHVRRGGSWSSKSASLRSANRAYGHPASRLRTTGFRVVRVAD